MKRLGYVLLISLTCLAFTSVAHLSYLPQHLCKKMDRHIKKAFSKTAVCTEIETPDEYKINHQFFKVSDSDTSAGYVIITRALGCQSGGCDKPKQQTDSVAFEQFFFMTAFDKQKQIKQVRVLEYTSNHGYEIASKSWLKQFTKNEPFTVGKNIDGISGATISVKSITKNVNLQREIIQEVE